MSGKNFNITDRLAVTNADSLGSGQDVFTSKTDDRLQFRSISTGQNLSTAIDSDSIRVDNFPVIDSVGNLPASPSVNDLIFFEPLRSTMTFTATSDWQGDVKFIHAFFKSGTINNPTWLNIYNSMLGFNGSSPFGLFIPDFSANVLAIRIIGFAVAGVGTFGGQMELHVDSIADPPTFSSTGVGDPLVLSAQAQGSIIFSTPALVPVGSFLQCYWRRTSDQVVDIQVGFLFANQVT